MSVERTIVWINGAFGAGKTSIAEELARRYPDWCTYDPEIVGWLTRHLLPDTAEGDFQDLPIWRRLVVDVGAALAEDRGAPLLVPMTLVRPDYRDEVFRGFADRGFELRAVTLRVSEAELRHRITDRTLIPDDAAADERARRWCLDQVERCLDALDDEAFGRHVSNEGRTVAATVDEIEQILGA